MPTITINEYSQNYAYNIGTNSYATVALPITSCWGSGYFDYASISGQTRSSMIEETKWQHYPATQAGLESFVSTYRGPASNYRGVKDHSYFMALTLLTAGYDVLVCRVSPGAVAKTVQATEIRLSYGTTPTRVDMRLFAKYPGTFGNNIKCVLSKNTVPSVYWSLVVYVTDTNGTQTAVENLIFVLDTENETDHIPHISEVTSNFVNIQLLQVTTTTEDEETVTTEQIVDEIPDTATIATDSTTTFNTATLAGGTDTESFSSASAALTAAQKYAYGAADSYGGIGGRYVSAGVGAGNYYTALHELTISGTGAISETMAKNLAFREWCYTAFYDILDLLKDKLNYAPNRIISPAWDDQDYRYFNGDQYVTIADGAAASTAFDVSPLHSKLMEVAYYSRCATSMLDIPRSLPRSAVWSSAGGYAQMLARYASNALASTGVDTNLFSTHSALCAPWAQYKYADTAKLNIASPAFLTLILQRSMILNQSLQYEWALPTNRRQSIAISKFDYIVPLSLLNKWQGSDGVGVNVITDIPDLGTTVWGNSTLYELPPATYQALANLSTRFLVNAVEDVSYRCGIAITFQYNNQQAYDQFYAGVTPLLDTMKNVGAIEDYYVRMSADIDAEDQIMANSVIGKVYLIVNGVVRDITVDLIALPPGTDLTQFA